jgi:hypothetical protein
MELLRKEFLNVYKNGDLIVSGGCVRGGDAFAEKFAKEYSIPIKIHYADWEKYHKGAGFIRNTYIAEDADVLIALLPNDGSHSNGTEDTLKKAKKLGKKIILVPQAQKVLDPKTFDPMEEV